VKKRLQSTVAHVRVELSNVKHLTGSTEKLDMLWDSFMVQKLTSVQTFSKAWVSGCLTHAKPLWVQQINELKTKHQNLIAMEKLKGKPKLGAPTSQAWLRYTADRKQKESSMNRQVKVLEAQLKTLVAGTSGKTGVQLTAHRKAIEA
jgi:hypothetical protein